jgi:actin-related protein
MGSVLMLTDFRYSQSKATALVVDIGALNTSVTALWDGMVLQKSESRLQFISTP